MAKSTRSFQYQRPSKEALRERANQRGGGFDSYIKQAYKMYKVRDGKNVIRILPPTWEPNPDKYYGYTIFVNYQIGPDNNSYLSLSKMKNTKDPIAEARLTAERDGDEELAKQLRPTERVLMWIIDRQAEDEGPLLWAAPFSKVAKAFLNLAFDEDTGAVAYVDDPEEGNDIRFYKSGSQLATDYDASKMKVLQSTPLHEDEEKQAEWLQYVEDNPIPDCLQFFDYKHISAVFNGAAAEPEEKIERKVSTKVEPDEPEDEPAPRRNIHDSDDEPAPRRTRPRSSGNGEDEEATPRRRPVQQAEPEEDDPPTGESIRDRIKRRRAEAAANDEE